MKLILSIFLAFFLMSGCGIVDDADSSSNDDLVKNNFTAIATNCTDSIENSYGCYGATKELANRKIVNGVWSVYTVSTTPVSNQSTYYDTYKYGYLFLSDGTVFKRDATASYSKVLTWGVSSSGDSVTISEDGTYNVSTQFFNDLDCFEVTNSQIDETLKMCNESYVNTNFENSAGYYGENVTFGNYTHGDYGVIGTWNIYGTTTTIVTLDINGTTSKGSEWGVSKDGKRITIDDKSYLVHKYPKSEECIESLELNGEFITPESWKLCKVVE